MMKAVKGRDNQAEVLLRKELWRRGFRYRLYCSKIRGRPDLAFASRRTVVFVDGDFWHGRLLVEQGIAALSRQFRPEKRKWWRKKITGNVRRDQEVTARLKQEGWRVVRMWETDILRDPEAAANAVARKLGRVTS